MEPSDIEAVLNFFRKNHLSVSESALIHDILDKSQLGSSDFRNFLFPPPLSPLKIPGRPPPPPEDLETSDDSSDQEFVSLGSSTTDLCSSDLTNPYGLKTLIRASSHASSDLLSQFGTARDYHEFDMQNDLCWYSQKDEDYAMPSCFHSSDPLGGPTEDKFVMTLEKENQIDDRILDSLEKTNSLDKACDLIKSATLCSSLEGIDLNGFHDIDIGIRSKNGVSCFEENDRSSNDYLIGDSKMIHEKDLEFNINGDYDAAKVEETDAIDTNDESLMNANGDEYEIFNLRIIHRKNRTGFEENKDLPIVLNSVIGSRYVVAEYLGSAAFSKVVQARDLQTGIDVCLKIIKNDKDFFDQSLDEIKLLKLVNKHDPADEHHILRLYDYFYFQEHLFIVSELLRANLYEFQKYNRESGGEPYFTLTRLQVRLVGMTTKQNLLHRMLDMSRCSWTIQLCVPCEADTVITRQCLEALDYLHGLGIIHCDLKPENILIKSYSRCEIKVIDLGSSCFQNDKLSLYVQSRSYRAPEVIIGLPYNPKVDLWSLGCILAELSSGDVLFPNDDLVFLLARVIGMLGPIDTDMLMRGQETSKYFTDEYDLYRINQETNQLEYIFPQETSLEEHVQVSDTLFIDFLRELLEINPRRRPTAREALQHPWLSFPYET